MAILVLTFMGDDRPGLVNQLSEAVQKCDGNWLTSRMTQLEGKFAGVAKIEVSQENSDNLTRTLKSQFSDSLTLFTEQVTQREQQDNTTALVEVIGPDRPGIIQEVTLVFANAGLNVINFNSDVTLAAMTGTPMFAANAEIEFGSKQPASELAQQLSEAAMHLGVDIDLKVEP